MYIYNTYSDKLAKHKNLPIKGTAGTHNIFIVNFYTKFLYVLPFQNKHKWHKFTNISQTT